MAKKAKKRVVKKAAKARPRQVILPKKLSSLIKIALRDMRKAEAKPKEFIIDMSEWFMRETVECRTQTSDILLEDHEVCVMCAAGSVMAFSLGGLKQGEGRPSDYPENQPQLEAIDYLRQGYVGDAYYCVHNRDYDSDDDADGLRAKVEGFDCSIPEYDRDNPKPFHREMEKLQKKLEKAGL